MLIGKAKWGEGRVDHQVYAKLKERAESALAYLRTERKGDRSDAQPWMVHLILFARRGFTLAVVAAAKADNAQLVTFQQIVADLERLPTRPIR